MEGYPVPEPGVRPLEHDDVIKMRVRVGDVPPARWPRLVRVAPPLVPRHRGLPAAHARPASVVLAAAAAHRRGRPAALAAARRGLRPPCRGGGSHLTAVTPPRAPQPTSAPRRPLWLRLAAVSPPRPPPHDAPPL